MNLQKIHDNIINNAKAQNRKKTKICFYEKHHIIPDFRFLNRKRAGPKGDLEGDPDHPDNLVLLTLKEHFLIHVLLWKIHKTKQYRDPVIFFKHKGIKNSRMYELARKEHIKDMIYNNPSTYLSEESRKSKSIKLKNRIFSETHRKKISDKAKGKKKRLNAVLSEESKEKIRQSVKEHHKNNGVSPETRMKLSKSMKGKFHSEEVKAKLKNLAKNRKKYTCHFCNIFLDGGNFNLHMTTKHFWTKEQCNDYKTENNTEKINEIANKDND